jgi:hypothetical protein
MRFGSLEIRRRELDPAPEYARRTLPYHAIRRGFREPRDFEVRNWTIPELKAIFLQSIGPAQIAVDGYLALSAQVSDVRFLPKRYRASVYTSEALRRMSELIPTLTHLADSPYITAIRR